MIKQYRAFVKQIDGKNVAMMLHFSDAVSIGEVYTVLSELVLPMQSKIDKKQDKEYGKGLSTNDLTDTLISQLNNSVDTVLPTGTDKTWHSGTLTRGDSSIGNRLYLPITWQTAASVEPLRLVILNPNALSGEIHLVFSDETLSILSNASYGTINTHRIVALAYNDRGSVIRSNPSNQSVAVIIKRNTWAEYGFGWKLLFSCPDYHQVGMCERLDHSVNLILTGDATGTAATTFSTSPSIPVTLSPSGVSAGTYQFGNFNVTIDAKGRITNIAAI